MFCLGQVNDAAREVDYQLKLVEKVNSKQSIDAAFSGKVVANDF